MAPVIVEPAGTFPATSKAIRARRVKPFPVEPAKMRSPPPFDLEPFSS